MWLKKPWMSHKLTLTGAISLLILFVSSFVSPAFAQTQTDSYQRTWDLKWRFKTAGKSLSQGTDTGNQISNGQIFESNFTFDSQYWLSDELFFDFEPSLKFQTGRVQALDGANTPSNSLGLRQAAVQWLPTNYLWFSTGALNQSEMHSSLVTDELPFPGARVTLKKSINAWDLRWVAESSIPSSQSLQTGTTQVEAVPVKNVAQMQMNWQPKSYLFSKNKLAYFSFQNLPSEVAEASSLIGNSTTRLNSEQWAFTYNYQGLEAISEWQLPLSKRIDFLFAGAAVQNQAAPTSLNTGYSIYSGFKYLINAKHDIQWGGRYFHVEPDTAPAFYSNSQNFRTNRIGYSTEALWHLKKQKLTVAASYSEAQVIFADPAQSRIRGFEIRLETDYESI